MIMTKKNFYWTLITLIIASQLLVLPLVAVAEDAVTTESTIDSAPSTETVVAPSTGSIAVTEPSVVDSIDNQPAVITGDANGDGELNNQDTDLIQDMITGQIPADSKVDLDGDDIIGPGDASLIIQEIKEQGKQNNEKILAEPQVLEAIPEPLVEAVPTIPYQLPNNPLCDGITGDLNGDGLINKYDTEVMIQMAKGLEPRNPCADLDLDGFISAGDISLLIKTYKIDLPAHPEIVAELAELSAEAAAKRALDSSSNSCTKGDANGDNKIDYKDIGLILQMMKSELPRTVAADLDGDGYIGPGDLSMVISMIKFSHAASADVTEEEKGNCNVPTASILYSIDGGETYATKITVKNGDILTIKVVYSKPLNQFEATFLDIDNGLPTDIYMPRIDASQATYNLVINNTGNLTATVSVRTINGGFPYNNIVLTSGSTFTISNSKPDVSGGSYGGGIAPVCTEVTYSDWSDCVDGKQTRNMITKTPEVCEWTEAQFAAQKQTCETENIDAQIVTETEEPAVLGIKVYPDGTLLRAINDFKIYIIENSFKRHIKTLQDLAAHYFGQTIYNVTPEILAAYPTIE
ncbi:MAG: hypothetical protein NTX82_04440 [Candidatus Parcubacteria bacterium]|nr:hypothetical protein [Candidatus Parcubacteria bacterium]